MASPVVYDHAPLLMTLVALSMRCWLRDRAGQRAPLDHLKRCRLLHRQFHATTLSIRLKTAFHAVYAHELLLMTLVAPSMRSWLRDRAGWEPRRLPSLSFRLLLRTRDDQPRIRLAPAPGQKIRRG